MHKRQRAYGELRDPSVELESELDPAISSELENFDPLSSTDTDQHQQKDFCIYNPGIAQVDLHRYFGFHGPFSWIILLNS